MKKVKFNFTLDVDVASYVQGIAVGERSKTVNAILKAFIDKEKNGRIKAA
jgi:3,4-dihydroxy-2-butanone 4-phosphate synthase